MPRRILWACAGVMMLVGCGTAHVSTGSSSTTSACPPIKVASAAPPGLEVTESFADYPGVLTDFPAAWKGSDVAVLASVTSSRSIVTADRIPMTYHRLRIDKVLGGRAVRVAAGDVVDLAQTGGPMYGGFVDNSSDPVFPAGYQAVLLLTRFTTGAYVVSDGPFGRFDLDCQGWLVPYEKQGIRFHGTVDQFATALTAAS